MGALPRIKFYSSLAKVFEKSSEIYGKSLGNKVIRVAKNQEINCQAVLGGEGDYTLEINTSLKGLKVYRVGYAHVGLPFYDGCDDGKYLKGERGSYPDPLFPVEDNKITLKRGKNTTLWLCTESPCEQQEGNAYIEITLKGEKGVPVTKRINIKVYNATLGEQRTLFTQWFHNDCIASVHKVDVFSSEHWALIEKYIRLASTHGMTMLLTPVLTPPLDTAVGEERPTVQLVDITLDGDEYKFDTKNLERYVKIATECGIKQIEVSHLFTQWGAKHAPKVIATVNGEQRRIFGWDTDATSEEYKKFLRAFVPTVIKALTDCGVERKDIFFHISDEPGEGDLEQYRAVSAILLPLISGCNQIDALSKIEFYKNGLVKTPVVPTNELKPFFDYGASGIWCYYCCAQGWDVSNRFIAMPSPRTRIIGAQIWKYDIVGFLHWGYNFYYTRLSRRKELNPYEETDAGVERENEGFPSGDAFSVYPYGDTAIPSLRQKVFKEALNDVRLLQKAEECIGRVRTMRLLDSLTGEDFTFENYPMTEELFEGLAKKCLEAIKSSK